MKTSKKVKLVYLPLIALSAGWAACNDKNAGNPTPTPASILATQGKTLEKVKAVDVPFQLYRLLASDPANVNLSPLSLKMAFAMVYPGTDKGTKAIFEQIFGFNSSETNPFASEMAAVQSFPKGEQLKTNDLNIANSAWFKSPKNVLPEFVEALKNQNASVNKLDIDEVNQWVETATHGKIKKLLDKLSPKVMNLFVNAIYFKAAWEFPFEKKDTYVGTFKSSPHQSLRVNTMHQQKQLPYYEDENSIWVEMPYAKSSFSMLFALPKEKVELNKVEEKLSSEYLKKVNDGLELKTVKLVLPQFKFDTKTSFRELMINAGYADLFSKGDYSKMMKGEFQISDVIQATSIEVNETGTEAAATTSMMMVGTGVSLKEILIKKFIADQPFLFVLQNKKSHEVYFLGRVYDPR